MCRLPSVPDWLERDLKAAFDEGRAKVTTFNPAAVADSPIRGVGRPAVTPPPGGCKESVFQDHARRLFQARGWLFYHTLRSKGSGAGFPDIIAGRGVGNLLVAELKVGRARPTKAQEQWLAFFRTIAGARVFVWRPEDWPQMEEAAR